ncbi:MAG TPA: hypothetical protein VF121_10335 [Thermoanaerobaculia bacterium]|nr:hypothetical protein [Thermoanaerobaculia bacterium]
MFDHISIDGRSSTIKDIRQLLVVHRLAGDETLIETLAQQADGAESIVTRWASSVHVPISRLETLAGEVLHTLGEWTVERHSQILQDMEAAETSFSQASHAAEMAIDKVRQLGTAVDLLRRLEQFRRTAPNLRQQIEAVEVIIRNHKVELERLQTRIVALAEEAARRRPILLELRNAQRTLKRNRLYLSSAVDTASSLAAELELAPTREALEAAVFAVRQQIDELTGRQISMHAAPAMRDLLDDVSRKLLDGEGRGLSDQIALDDPELDLQLTVSEVRVGIGTRRVQLEGQPPPPEARAVVEQLEDARSRLERLKAFEEGMDSVDRYRRLVGKNEERVDRALPAANPQVLAELQQLEARRRVIDNELLELATERAVLCQQLSILGGEAPDVIESRLTALLSDLDLARDALPTASAKAQEAEGKARLALGEARQRLAAIRRDVARAEADVKRTTRSLGASGALRWIGKALSSTRLPSDGAPLREQLEVIGHAHVTIAAVIERLGKHRTQHAAVASALRGIARQLRGQDAEAVMYVAELERWFGDQFSEWFNSESVRKELLPDADDQISVDVRQMEVRWLEKGRERSRPLEAFSSGEQAFAYTRARLGVLDQEIAKAPNRLIVLDEFGAFIAHDRLSVLVDYLRKRAADHPEDQVLVILPLSHDYASEAGSSVGKPRENLEHLAKQIEAQRFAVRVLAA